MSCSNNLLPVKTKSIEIYRNELDTNLKIISDLIFGCLNFYLFSFSYILTSDQNCSAATIKSENVVGTAVIDQVEAGF